MDNASSLEQRLWNAPNNDAQLINVKTYLRCNQGRPAAVKLSVSSLSLKVIGLY